MDETKNRANQRKHGISFELASEVFDDPLCLMLLERAVDGEERWQTFGYVDGTLFVMVAHTVRESLDEGEIVRIISARRATAKERHGYEIENR